MPAFLLTRGALNVAAAAMIGIGLALLFGKNMGKGAKIALLFIAVALLAYLAFILWFTGGKF